MKKVVLAVVALAAASCAVAVWSQGTRPSRPTGGIFGRFMSCPAIAVRPPSAAMVDGMASELQLTRDQVTKLKSSLTKYEKTLEPLQARAAQASQALRSALFAANYNAANVKTLAAKAEKAEAGVISASIDAWTQVRSVLRADQAGKLQGLMTRRPGMPRAGFGGPEGGPMPPGPRQ